MAITITVDNDRTTTPPNPPFDPLLLDETAGVQTPASPDDGNEINVTLTAGALGGFATAFNAFLNSVPLALTTAQKEYARDHDGASSASNFVLVTTSAGETINDLFFANSTGGVLAGVQVAGMLTLDGDSVFLWSNGNFGSSSDFCVATTSSTAGAGEVVAAFYLNEAADHKSAQVQMVVFEPLEHNNDGLDPDDALNFTDALRIGASGSLSFDFDQLASSSSLWVAVGNSSEAVLITGSSPRVDNTTGKKTNTSDVIHTSQGGAGATIGVNNQLFDNVGESATFTLVTGLTDLVGSDDGVLSDYAIDDPGGPGIEYGGYLQNVLGAGIFISQDQGSPSATKSLDINVFRTNNASEEEGFGYVYSNAAAKTGNALTDDIAVNVTTVSVRDSNNALIGTWVLGADPDGAGPLRANGATVSGVQVTITGNNIDVNNFGIQYTISWTTAEPMNRFNVVNEAGKWDIGRVDVARTVPQNTPIGDKLFVEDDGPTPGSPVLKHVDEDAMTGVAGSDLSTGHVEAPADADGIAGEQDEVTFSQADLAATVNSGTDAPAVFSLNASLANGTAVTTTGGANVFSKGDQVFYRTVGGVIQGVTDAGTADERIIFTITRNDNALIGNPSDDTFTFDLKDQLDHANGSGELSLVTLNVSPAFSAKDSDNDPVNLGTLIRVEVENDTPRPDGDFVRKHVDEDGMTGAAGSDLSTGHVEAPADADGIAGEQDEVSFSQADLQGVVTNGADEPVLFGLNASLANGSAVKTTGGADVFSKGDQVFYRTVGGVIQGVTDAGTADERIIFTITRNDNALIGDKSDDTFTFDLKDQLDHANGSGELSLVDLNVTPAFSASDLDGDAVDFTGSNAIRVEVENDTPRPDGDFVLKHVDEDGMTGAAGSDLSTGHVEAPADADGIAGEQDEVSFSQADLQGVVTNGADEPVLFGLNASLANGSAVKTTGGADVFSKGDQVFYRTVGGVIQGVTDAGTADERIIFTITRNDNALIGDKSDDTFTFDLKDQLDHANGSGELSLVDLNVTPAFSASDLDGDAVDFTGSNAIRVEVENDTPRPDGDFVLKHVDEDGMTGAAGSDLSTGHVEAPADADGIAGEQDEVSFSQADLQGVVTNGADEPVLFGLNASLANGSAVKTTGGADVFSKGDQVFYRTVGGVIQGVTDAGTADERIIFTITRNDNALIGDKSDDTFTFDLKDQLDHANGSGELSLVDLNVTPAFSASDLDGDAVDFTGSNAIRVEVENDTPRPDGDTISKEVHEDALTGGNTPDAGDSETKVVTVTYTKANLIDLATTGADEDLTFSLNTAASGQPGAVIGTNVVTTGGANVQSSGVNVVWAAGAGGSLIGVISGTATTVFTLTPSGDDFVFTLVEPVDHSGAENDLELLPIDLTSAFKAVDFDLDPLTLNPDSVVLNIENDLPIFNGQILSKTLDWVDNGFVTGSLFGRVGSDDPASYIIDKYTDLAGYVETLSADGKTLTYSIGGTTYFTLALNDAANSGAGGYTFTVNEPPPNPVLELNFQDLDSGQNLFGTVAFNKANINNNGTPGNASDDFLPDGGLMTFPTNIDINDGEAGESNDGSMTNSSGTTNTSKGGGPVTIGNSNQAFDNAGEGAWFVYVDNPVTTAVSGVGLNANLADDADNVKFDGTVEVTKASVEIVQASGAGTAKRPGPAMLITAYDIDPQTVGDPLAAGVETSSRNFTLDPSATGDQANIIGVKIYDANGVLIEYRTNEDNGATNDGDLEDIPGADESAVVIQFNLDDNGGTPADPTDDIYSVLVSNLKANYTIEWETEGVHDAAKVERAAGSYDIGGFNLLQGQAAPDVDFEFSVAIQDKDGDLIHFNGTNDVFDDFRIKVDGTGGFNDPSNVDPTGFLTSYDLI